MAVLRWTTQELDAYTRRMAGLVAAAPLQIAPTAPKAHRPEKARSELEVEMERQLLAAGIPFVAEFKPLENRRFRIDFALPDHMIGVECEGAVHRIKSRWSAFPERHHLLSQAGWRMVYVGRPQIMSGQALDWVRECMGKHNDRVERSGAASGDRSARTTGCAANGTNDERTEK